MHGNLVDMYRGVTLLQNSTPKFALALIFDGFLQRQKQISIALPTHWRTCMHVVDIHQPTVLKYSCHNFRDGVCDLEHASSRRISLFPFHEFKLRFLVLVMNPRLIAYNHTWMEEFCICVMPGQQGDILCGSGILHFWRQYPFSTHLGHRQMLT